MKPPRVGVSDHAIVRYLERVGGFDIEGPRRSISHRTRGAALAGASAVQIDGWLYVLAQDPRGGMVVVTVMERLDAGRILHDRPDRGPLIDPAEGGRCSLLAPP